SGQAIALNVIRSLVMNTLIITLLPRLYGNGIVWHTFGIYEALVLIIAMTLKKTSEVNGVVYK
ncbi:MAG: MATE family efflux transporter, partial [Huintestinicola sp.]